MTSDPTPVSAQAARPSRFFSTSGLVERLKLYRTEIIELIVMFFGALWVGSNLLDFAPLNIPYGADFLPILQSHHFWEWFKECGLCALWDGKRIGGFPAMADILGSNLHPLAALIFLLFDPVTGSKLLAVFSIWFSGLGQWLMAREFKLGRVARLWGTFIGMSGAHLASRMDNGLVPVMLAVGMASLALPVALGLARQPTWRKAIVLGALLALTALSGQGYIQVGFLITAPLFLILLLDGKLRISPAWRYFLGAVGLALLLAGPLLVPFMHFFPNFNKGGEPAYNHGQPLEYLVLNLVIRDARFLQNDWLQKPGAIHMNAMYIGWVPVLLAFLSFKYLGGEHKRQLAFLWSFSLLVFWAASSELLKLISPLAPFVEFVRFPLTMTPLAVVALLSISAYALDRLFRLDWSINFSVNAEAPIRLRVVWLLIIPLVLNILQTREFSKGFYVLVHADYQPFRQAFNKIGLSSLQWIAVPEGMWPFHEIAAQNKIKIVPGIRAFEWNLRKYPEPRWMIKLKDEPEEGAEAAGKVGDFYLYSFPTGREYAAIVDDQGEFLQACAASGWGGDLTVNCQSDQGGTLVVKENRWDSWYAWLDGKPVQLLPDQWLSVNVPAGSHSLRFRYLPWDAPLGILVGLAGIALSIWLWRKSSSTPAQSQ